MFVFPESCQINLVKTFFFYCSFVIGKNSPLFPSWKNPFGYPLEKPTIGLPWKKSFRRQGLQTVKYIRENIKDCEISVRRLRNDSN